jgi:hypothetical protein
MDITFIIVNETHFSDKHVRSVISLGDRNWANSRPHTRQKFKYGKVTGSLRVASGLTLAERLGPSTQSTHGSRARSGPLRQSKNAISKPSSSLSESQRHHAWLRSGPFRSAFRCHPLLPSGQTPLQQEQIEIDCECRVRGPRKSLESDSTPSWKTSTFLSWRAGPFFLCSCPQIDSLPEIAPTPFMKPRVIRNRCHVTLAPKQVAAEHRRQCHGTRSRLPRYRPVAGKCTWWTQIHHMLNRTASVRPEGRLSVIYL